MKSSATLLWVTTGVKWPGPSGAGKPRILARNCADTKLSLAWTMVWSRATVMGSVLRCDVEDKALISNHSISNAIISSGPRYDVAMSKPVRPAIGRFLGAAAKDVSRAFEEALTAAGGSLPMWLVLMA